MPQDVPSLAEMMRAGQSVPMLRGPDEPRLRTEVPALYGLLAGLVSSAPDSLARGSVLDPEADLRNEGVKIGADVGFGLSTLAQLLPGLGPLLKGVNLAKTASEVPSLVRQMGAINKGGAPNLMLSHAFDAYNGPKIAEQGLLAGPSFGVTSNLPNQFKPGSPQIIMRAGAVSPENFPHAVHINRDGYFPNPRAMDYKTNKFDPSKQDEAFQDVLENAKKLFGPNADQRLTEMGSNWAGTGQGLQVAASPSARTMQEFERHPQLAGALLKAQGSGWAELESVISKMGLSVDDLKDMYRQKLRGEPLPAPFEDLWRKAMNTGSDMSELKLPHFAKISPENAAIYLPASASKEAVVDGFKKLQPFQDKGYHIFSYDELEAMSNVPRESLVRVPGASGNWNLPPRLSDAGSSMTNELRAWLDRGRSPRDVKAATPAELQIPSFTGRVPKLPSPEQAAEELTFTPMQSLMGKDVIPPSLAEYLKAKYIPPTMGLKAPTLDELLGGASWLNKP